MYIIRIFYMCVPSPKIWKKNCDTLADAKMIVAKKYKYDHTALGYVIRDDKGNVIIKDGVVM